MYYPKSQITSNQYSNGDLYYKSSGQSYIGYYYKISNGKIYTGKTPQDGPNQELVLNSSITNTDLISKIPPHYQTLPTENDYTIGEFRRYFCKKSNELIYIEISQDIYTKLLQKDPSLYWQLYLPFFIPWLLTGTKEVVYNTNHNIVELTIARNNYFMFGVFLKEDYLKYWVEK